MSKALGYAEEARMIDRMPKINYVQVRQKRLLWITKEEEQKVFKFLEAEGESEFLRFVTILLDTGMRPGELMALAREDIDWDNNTILVYGAKTDKYRMLPMTGRVQQALKDQIGFYPSIHTQRPIDPTGRPGALFNFKYYTIQRLWMRVQKHMEWGVNAQHTLYVCRHTFASRLVQADVPLPVITQLMGHSSYQQTLHYAKLSGDQGQAAIATLEGLLGS
ncbi:MAG: site-specific integrase [Candidatus Competibacteraceae bacterium]|nr:site-specific integrase [Candidatus Competibacteraceae bacterium]